MDFDLLPDFFFQDFQENLSFESFECRFIIKHSNRVLAYTERGSNNFNFLSSYKVPLKWVLIEKSGCKKSNEQVVLQITYIFYCVETSLLLFQLSLQKPTVFSIFIPKRAREKCSIVYIYEKKPIDRNHDTNNVN